MEKIGMISVTLNAVNPMVQFFMENVPNVKVMNYLDEGLMDLVRKEGTVTDHSLARLIEIIAKACEDGAKGILLTCTVFSPYVNRLQSLFTIPIIGVDGAMLEKAVRLGGKTAILCTFAATMESTSKIFDSIAQRLDVKPDMKMFLLEDAFHAVQKGNKTEHDRIIAQKVKELEPDFDVIVLAQISMAHVAKQVPNPIRPILTSPQSAVDSLMQRISNN